MNIAAKVLLAVAMVGAGVAHFLVPNLYAQIVPDLFPDKLLIVYVSGVFEVLLGAGLLVPKTQRLAAWGLIALYIAVFPANVKQALEGISYGPGSPLWLTWARLPLQGLVIAWAYRYTRIKAAAGSTVGAPAPRAAG